MRRLLVFGHRGARGYAPENTNESFSVAVEMGVDGIELDVHLSKDGELVVMHDDTVDRTTDGHGAVRDLTVEQLKKLDAGVKFGRKWRGARIPTLGDVFDRLGRSDYRIELKHSGGAYPGVEERLVSCVRDFGLVHHVEVTSFDYDALESVRRLDGRFRTGIIMHGKARWFIPIAKKLGCTWMHSNSDLVGKDDVSAAHVKGFKLGMWTVNSTESAERAIRLGVDGVTSDFPDVVMRAARMSGR
ncbi:MAG: glycerophosphodiester phosphodiesterase [Nitrososphaerota archaeon]|nr:glycerophosphodiester phosphodiesterase [Nitrososphaerota archaeon]MDG6973692.1 glycerophosphodiester phosphodiesterase [Nitrososphaerota archaeon]MDG6975484.1 glycerophosphodiester phosphodiesterase [Nitrososphaerota archaeon]MDG7010260.1 glycerophosphodiester phosphodiesterase [Nitrososphaerota archaeon]